MRCVSHHDTFLATIQSTRGKLIAQVLAGRPGKGFPADLFRGAARNVAMLNAAHGPEDLSAPPSNRLEALSGDRAGQHSIRINGQWRICFTSGKAGTENPEIADDH